ncbi:MAG: AraC family transcriptional regulator [Halanaerobiaceae bacterium]|nr:AraC family transcriptional regulator [Halanaerobiaceae bacterium]
MSFNYFDKNAKVIDRIDHLELSLNECGREKCSPLKRIISFVKDWHVLHYIVSGKGTFILDGRKFKLKRGNIFYIPSGFEAEYYPDPNEPWSYIWVGFSGIDVDEYLSASGFSLENPVFFDEEMVLNEFFYQLVSAYNHFGCLNIRSLGYLYIIFSYLIELNKHKQNIAISIRGSHVKEAIEFISYNYQFNISVKDIANSLNLTPNYLSSIFKSEIGLTTKQFLTKYRMEKACSLLNTKGKSIKDIALAVGYKNQLHFSSEFKKYMKMSPSAYRKILLKQENENE